MGAGQARDLFKTGAGQARDLFKMGAGQARDLFKTEIPEGGETRVAALAAPWPSGTQSSEQQTQLAEQQTN
jgi:hypothetical protein